MSSSSKRRICPIRACQPSRLLINQRLEEAKRKIIEALGDSAITPTGELKPEYNDEKIQFAKEIKELEQKLGKNNIRLESFILSKTKYESLIDGISNPQEKDEYIENHVLFLYDINWLEILFRLIEKNSP